MTSQSNNDTTALQRTPLSKAGKHLLVLSSSSPLSSLSLIGSKRTKLSWPEESQEQVDSSLNAAFESERMELESLFGGAIVNNHEPKSNGITPNGKRDVIVISSDPPTAEEDSGSIWSMHTATPEMSDGLGGDTILSIAPSIAEFFFHRGQDRLIGEDNFPTVIYVNRQNGKVYQSVVDRELFFIRRDITGFEDTALWLQTNVYIGDLFDNCVNATSDPVEAFPILHRHANHLAITEQSHLTDEANAPSSLKSVVRREWARLVFRYGEFNDIQHEQKALIDKAFTLLGRYQSAIASRDLTDAMAINNMIVLLGDALNELALNEYVIRELFYRDTSPAFLTAIA